MILQIPLQVKSWLSSKRKRKVKVTQLSDFLWPHGPYSPWNFPGKNTGVGSLSLLQGIFPTWGSNPGLPYCRRILYQLSHKGSPRILEWVAYPFCSGSSWPRNQTWVSCIAGRFFTNWAIREAKVIRRGLKGCRKGGFVSMETSALPRRVKSSSFSRKKTQRSQGWMVVLINS